MAAGDQGFIEAELPTASPEDVAVPGTDAASGGGGAIGTILRASAHPGAALFHVGFKIAAIASYITLSWFTSSFVLQFVVTVTLLAFDFWTVKNVTGRLLVGLRWWSDMAEDGTTQWRFESIENAELLNKMDGRIFWWTMYITPLIWILLGVVCILKFHVSWLVVVLIALVLNIANTVGYFKCSKAAQDQVRNLVSRTVFQSAMERFWT